MDIEQLNKSQVILLTMLVSFVTSIATGIVTVSLVEKAPTDVTRVMQRVVERTVERVSPATQQATVITKEKTIIIKESDLIAAAVAENKDRIVTIRKASDGSFVALGAFVDSQGTLATDASVLIKDEKYVIETGTGTTTIPVQVSYKGGARGIALLKADIKKVIQKPVTRSKATLKLGQTLIAFVGNGSVTQGIVARLGNSGIIGTTIASPKVTPGSLLLTVNGDVIGMSTGKSRKIDVHAFAPIQAAFAQAVTGIGIPKKTSTTTSTSTDTVK